jgi:hypothetical protein
MPREPALRNTCRCPRTSLPQRAFHPTNHVQQDIHPTDNPPPSARKSGGRVRRRVGRRRGRPPSSTRQNLRALVMQSSAPAPGAPSPWDSVLGAIEDSISQCTFLQMTYTAENPHADGSTAPGARPRFRPPRRRDPHATSPAPTTTGWRENRCPYVSKRLGSLPIPLGWLPHTIVKLPSPFSPIRSGISRSSSKRQSVSSIIAPSLPVPLGSDLSLYHFSIVKISRVDSPLRSGISLISLDHSSVSSLSVPSSVIPLVSALSLWQYLIVKLSTAVSPLRSGISCSSFKQSIVSCLSSPSTLIPLPRGIGKLLSLRELTLFGLNELREMPDLNAVVAESSHTLGVE